MKLVINLFFVGGLLFLITTGFTLKGSHDFHKAMSNSYNYDFEANGWSPHGKWVKGEKSCSVPASEDSDWADLSAAQQTAAAVLGWNNATWTTGSPAPASEGKVWSELTGAEREAAGALGWTEETWDCGRFQYKRQECSKLIWQKPNTTYDGLDRAAWNNRKLMFFSLGFHNRSDNNNAPTSTYEVIDDFGSSTPSQKDFKHTTMGNLETMGWCVFSFSILAGLWFLAEFCSISRNIHICIVGFKNIPFIGKLMQGLVMFAWPFLSLAYYAAYSQAVFASRLTVDSLGHPCFFPSDWRLGTFRLELLFWMYAASFMIWIVSMLVMVTDAHKTKERKEGEEGNMEWGSATFHFGRSIDYEAVR